MSEYRKIRQRRKRRRRILILLSTAVLLALVAVAAFYGVGRWNSGQKVEMQEKERNVETETFPSKDSDRVSNPSVGNNSATAAKQARELLGTMTLEEKAAQLFIVTPEALTGYERVTAAGGATKEAFDRYPVGGVVYFKDNLVSESQVRDMLFNTNRYSLDRIGVPVFLSVDEEGGSVARIGNHPDFQVPKIEDMAVIGKSGDKLKAYEAGKAIGEYLSRMGFNLDYAPVADVLGNSENTVSAKRSFGADGALVAEFTEEVRRGLEEQGILTVLKHFPGHGSTAGDTHDGYAYTEKTLEEMEASDLIPFRKGIEAGADLIMVAHISTPKITKDETPASMSGKVVTDLLRNRLGFQGVVVTDALNMGAIAKQYTPGEAAVKALLAGVDMLLMPADFSAAYQGVLDGVSKGTITESRLDESVYRILELKFRTLT